MKRLLQAVAPSADQTDRDTHVVHRGDELLTEDEARRRVKVFDTCKDPTRQFQKWARRSGCPVRYVGRRRLYVPRLLDAFLEQRAGRDRRRSAPLKIARVR